MRARTTAAALVCGLGVFVAAATPVWAAEGPGPVDTTATASPTTEPGPATSTEPTAEPTATPTAGTTPTGEPTAPETATRTTPAAEPTSPDPGEEDPVIIPTAIPTALPTALPKLPKQPIKLSQTCSGRTGTWTLTNVTRHQVGYGWVDTKLDYGVGVLPAGQSIQLGHGFAVLAIALSSRSFLPVNLPLIALSKCGDVPSFGGSGATLPPGGALPIGSPGSPAAPVAAAPVAKPVVTDDVHFTG